LPAPAGVQDHDGYTKLSEDAFLKYFANGVEHGKAEVLYAEQQPTAAARFGERTTIASWHSKPTFCAVSKNDQTMSPDLETLTGDTYESDNRGAGSGHLSLVWTRNAFKTETLGVRIQLERGESEWNARLGVHSDDQVAAIAICKGIKMSSKYSPHTISLKVFKGDNREARQEGST
jgi:hypothetical protein